MAKKSGLGTSGLGALFGDDVVRKVNKENQTQQADAASSQGSAVNPASAQSAPVQNAQSSPAQNQGEHAQQSDSSQAGTPLMVSLGLIQPNNKQPRKVFEEEPLNELAKSIEEYGIIEPLIVKKISSSLYEIIAGERRWRAAKKAGLSKVPVIIKDVDEQLSSEMTLIENIQREDLNIVEEALAYQDLIGRYGYTQEELADKVAKNRATIANAMRILKLDKEIIDLVKQGKLSAGHARALVPIEDQTAAKEIAKFIVDRNLSVRDTEYTVKEYLKKSAPGYKPKKQIGQSAQIKVLEEQLSQSLGTKVTIVQKSNKKGKIEIEFYSDQDLDNLYRLLKNK